MKQITRTMGVKGDSKGGRMGEKSLPPTCHAEHSSSSHAPEQMRRPTQK